jgi:hypothetical protein
VRRTKFAHTTNLACEHHFGDLDSSQKGRPRASMHHHSSIQLLKRNRKQMMSWLEDMTSTDRSSIIKKARKVGRTLRELHINNEKSVISTVHEEMMKPKPTKRKRKQKEDEIENDIEAEFDNLKAELPVINNFITNEYVAIAYQDDWYPGIVVELVNEQKAYVKFMTPCQTKGVFKWPSKEDKQLVDVKFSLMKGFSPDCIGSSGRQWFIPNFNDIQKIFELYKNIYF